MTSLLVWLLWASSSMVPSGPSCLFSPSSRLPLWPFQASSPAASGQASALWSLRPAAALASLDFSFFGHSGSSSLFRTSAWTSLATPDTQWRVTSLPHSGQLPWPLPDRPASSGLRPALRQQVASALLPLRAALPPSCLLHPLLFSSLTDALACCPFYSHFFPSKTDDWLPSSGSLLFHWLLTHPYGPSCLRWPPIG